MTDWRIICPLCFAGKLPASDTEMSCNACGHTAASTNGVWQLLTYDRMDHYRDFLENYTKVRIAEGRGTYSAATLRALPDCPESHRLASQWNIRAVSFACLLRLLKDRLKPHDKVLDLGAGTGWLSHRLALDGFSPCAIDLSTDVHDGLGAAGNFDTDWPRLQAEYDGIPLGDNAVKPHELAGGIADAPEVAHCLTTLERLSECCASVLVLADMHIALADPSQGE